MTFSWWVRSSTFVGIWIVVVTVLGLMDMRPSVTALAALGAATAAVLFLVLDLGDLAVPIDWRATSDGGASARGADARVGLLRRQISDARVLDGPLPLHRTLVDLVDDALAVHHGVDRLAEPDRALALMGDDLSHFVAGSTSATVIADPQRLSAMLARIESLATPPGVARRPDLQGRP